jgi:hypothetical protein
MRINAEQTVEIFKPHVFQAATNGTMNRCREFAVQLQIRTLLPRIRDHESLEKNQVGCLFTP